MRLLKYPLLFQVSLLVARSHIASGLTSGRQSLLYHSDPASPEYDSTQAMAVEIDSIVKSIESEKISEEERTKVRDIWSRIEGIVDKVCQFFPIDTGNGLSDIRTVQRPSWSREATVR
jgi:hypothetical protein